MNGPPPDDRTRIGTERVRGLDTLRFVLAAWVMIGHYGRLPYAEWIPREPDAWLVVRGVYNNLVSGPAAVIVFFVISGFCIHFPYRDATRVDLFPYFARRHIRILTPVAAALLWARVQGLKIDALGDSILWSLVCEEVYYTIYPLLLKFRVRWGWARLIGVASVAAVAVAATNPRAGDYPSFGWQLNWVLGLPCWLLGCQLAQNWPSLREKIGGVRGAEIWAWRFGMLGLSAGLSILRFHTPLTYPWTLNLFAFSVYPWLAREIVRAATVEPPRVLEWAGTFSYSIYLVHMHGIKLVRGLLPLQGEGIAPWIVTNVATLVACYAFYRVIERPSHRLARGVYSMLQRRRAPRLPAVLHAPSPAIDR